ncbi:MAG: rubredoxin-like domain-containing protein [Halarchaeum sp.]
MSEDSTVKLGTVVYNEDGEKVGTVRGFDEDGFFVTNREGAAAFTVEHEHTPHDLGEAELTWRCSDCGEVGDIEELPDSCPSCGAPREAIYYWTED